MTPEQRKAEDQRIVRMVAEAVNAPDTPPVLARWLSSTCSFTGLGYGLGMAQRERYKALLWPYDPPWAREQMARTQSSCAVTWEAIARAMRVDDERLYRPIAPRTVGRDDPTTEGRDWGLMTLGNEIAKAHGAYRHLAKWSPDSPDLEVGHSVVIGLKGGAGVWARRTANFEHILTVIAKEGDVVHSVDGGQPEIAIRSRRVFELPALGELWLADLSAVLEADGRPSKGRRVLCAIDNPALRLREDV